MKVKVTQKKQKQNNTEYRGRFVSFFFVAEQKIQIQLCFEA